MMNRIVFTVFLLLFSSTAWAQRISQLPALHAAQSQTQAPQKFAPANPAPAMAPPPQAGTEIAAVVNENVITTIDLGQRLRLAILSSGLPDTADVRSHLLPQILRSMIDEQLEIQEAKRLDISVSKEEINDALARIGRDNHIPGDFLQFITAHGASSDALVTQVKNGLLWNKVIQRELRPRVDIGDDEIDAVINRMRTDAGREEYLVSEILLPVDSPKDEDQLKQVADNLVSQLKSGANFSAIARQFSQGVGASEGGDIGWIKQGQLSSELNRFLATSAQGQISDPIRTPNGFHILSVREKRTVSLGDPSKASVTITQAFRPYANTDKDQAMLEATRLHNTVKDCANLPTALSSFSGWKTEKMGTMDLSKAQPAIADKVRDVSVGSSSEPLKTEKGIVLMFVCSRNDGNEADRDAIYHSIGTEKLELQARHLLRDLRRSAYLDIRLGKNT